jgi:hypothetical protein
MAPARIDCHRCLHYFVTWDPRFPHGCRCMGFKSRMVPSGEVRRALPGHDCLLYQAKTRRHGSASNRPRSCGLGRPPSK